MPSKRGWYGVKTLYRVEALGKPRAKDRHFDHALTLVEERVVVFRARNHDEAIRKAEREAKEYARFVNWRNPYGQRLRQRYLRACESYELLDPPVSGAEVFSKTFLAKKSVSDQRLNRAHVVQVETRSMAGKRKNFLNEEFSGRVGA